VVNPFELGSALKFGLIFAAIIFVSRAAQHYHRRHGRVHRRRIGGTHRVDAITLSMANLSRGGSVSESTAAVSILIAVVVNTIVKAGIAISLGALALRRYNHPRLRRRARHRHCAHRVGTVDVNRGEMPQAITPNP
jgi:uncharacterized membrane protein (DUF4010 family)